MNILHIACTNGDMCNGVQVVVPRHLDAQAKYANVAFVNISNIKTNINCTQFEYNEEFSIEKLPKPFNKPDIVVFHECYRIQYIKIAKELRKLNVPYVILPHGELSKGSQSSKRLKKIAANILIFNRFINNSVGLQMLSDGEMKNTKFGKYKFIGTNGINIPESKKQRFNDSNFKIVYIGRLDVYIKGLDLMIEGVAKCADYLRLNACTLDIYGPDILGRRAQVASLIEKYSVGDIIILRDPVFNDEKERVLLEADTFIQTSRTEGMPMGILETLSYGLPCMITEGTTLGNFVNECDAGWVCATDSNGIAKMLTLAISQRDELSTKSQNARNAVQQSFSWDMIAEQTIEKYKGLLEN